MRLGRVPHAPGEGPARGWGGSRTRLGSPDGYGEGSPFAVDSHRTRERICGGRMGDPRESVEDPREPGYSPPFPWRRLPDANRDMVAGSPYPRR